MMAKLLANLSVLAIRGYQAAVRPLFLPSCRFVPSCSDFAIQQIQALGVRKGWGAVARRVLRCHPAGDWLTRTMS